MKKNNLQKPIPVFIYISIIVALAIFLFFIYTNRQPSENKLSIEYNSDQFVTKSFDSCGSSLPKQNFSLDIPASWQIETEKEDPDYQKYLFTNDDQWLEILCGQGFGGGCSPENETEFVFNGQTISGCFSQQDGQSHLWALYVQSPEPEIALSFSSKNLNRELLEQIFSTLKFTKTVFR